jgi:ATP-dependent DNA helicase DinG
VAGRAGSSTLEAAVDAAFAPGGPLSRGVAEYEPRPGQRTMAGAVARAVEEGRVLLAEAGTGTGKTLAYLVPALLSGRRVLISTGTKTLQEQIYEKDLGDLRTALGIAFTATCLKGRGNYLCLHRFDQFRENPLSLALLEPEVVERLVSWGRETATGDRAELEGLPDDFDAWSDLSASSENCLGPSCPRHDDCFVTRMRQQAARSDLVVVNHHLLCADASVRQESAGGVIPECEVAVIDEAHQLEEVATNYFGLAVSTFRIEELLRDAVRALVAAPGVDETALDAIRRAAGSVADRAARFFDVIRPARGDARGEERVRLRPGSLDDAQEPASALCEALDEVQGEIVLAPKAPEDLRAIARRAGELRDHLSFLVRAGDPDYVYYLEARGRGLALRASPVDVSAIVRELLLDRLPATVLTSATLAVAGSFAYIRSRLGIGDAEEIRVPSEFAYREQAILYLPPRMPDPRSPQFAAAATREIARILERTEGRAFVLFTSYSMLREVERGLPASLPYPVLVQGQAPRSVLLRRFRSLGNAVLLATSSFWQGVDVVGEALSCVIVDKIPFASPGDPVTAARIEAIQARGESAFTEYQVPLAVLTLLQGFGRLIRHRQDRGVLALLDPRVRTKGYGATFLEALPPAPVTSQLEDITRFFAH